MDLESRKWGGGGGGTWQKGHTNKRIVSLHARR